MGKPLDEPSKLLGLFTFEDTVILFGVIFVLLFMFFNLVKVLGFWFSSVICSSIFMLFFAFFFLKNTWPRGIIPAFFKFLTRPKLILPGREASSISESLIQEELAETLNKSKGGL
jgi:hypothetical protein